MSINKRFLVVGRKETHEELLNENLIFNSRDVDSGVNTLFD